MMEGLHKKTVANRLLKPGENTYPGQVNSKKQNSSWTFKLLQGKVGLDELNKGLSGKLEQKDIQKLLKYVLNNPLRQRNRAAVIISFLYGVPKSKISSSLLVSPAGVYKCIKRFESNGIDEALKPSWNIPKKLDDPKYRDTVFKILPMRRLHLMESTARHGEWKILNDPKNGKTYSGKMRLVSPGQLDLRGYIGISLIGRTATWTRPEVKADGETR